MRSALFRIKITDYIFFTEAKWKNVLYMLLSAHPGGGGGAEWGGIARSWSYERTQAKLGLIF